jgi:hypothetical protein
MPPVRVAPVHLRRLALAHQGLDRARAFGGGRRGVLAAIERLHHVQIDTIAVVERAHHHTLHTRVPDYAPAHLDALVGAKRVFEYWAHAAAYLPMRDFRFALPRMHAVRDGSRPHWFRQRDRQLERRIVDRIRAEGPLRARDFAAPAERPRGGWWDWRPAKRALEALFFEGTLASVRRDGFEKVYDLMERALPASVDTRVPGTAEHAAFLVDAALAAHGFTTPREAAFNRRDHALRRAVAADLADRVARGELVTATPDGSSIVYLPPAALDRRPRITRAVTLLSPFDNTVHQRERASSVFGFDYRIECYTPAAQRRYGYFCLPVLHGDAFAGRADCKAERAAGVLRVRALHVERDVDADAFAAAFAAAARSFAAFNGCGEVSVGTVAPARLRRHVVRALATGSAP